jgi:hypothetical protein
MRLRTICKPEIHHAIVMNSERVETYGLTASYGPPHSWPQPHFREADKVTVAACLMENSTS